MRTNRTGGFTLIELLIVIAIIGILAAVLIPNLLNARKRAFDTAAQSCLKEVASNEEMLASLNPWVYSMDLTKTAPAGTTFNYDTTDINPAGTTGTVNLSSCEGVYVVASTVGDPTNTATAAGQFYAYNAAHQNGGNWYHIEVGHGVLHGDAYAGGAAPPATTVAP